MRRECKILCARDSRRFRRGSATRYARFHRIFSIYAKQRATKNLCRRSENRHALSLYIFNQGLKYGEIFWRPRIADAPRSAQAADQFSTEPRPMKPTVAILALAAACFAANTAFAVTTDDVKWINQCVNDNKGDAAAAVVLKYCTCMNNKMSDNETQSITQWEKTHVAERKACDKEAGWK
jgi:hypothetical protein